VHTAAPKVVISGIVQKFSSVHKSVEEDLDVYTKTRSHACSLFARLFSTQKNYNITFINY